MGESSGILRNWLVQSLRWIARGSAVVFLVLVIMVGTLTVVFPSWSRAQFDVLIALAITQRTPVIAPLARLVTDKPRIAEIAIAGEATTIARPGGGGGPWPAIVFVNGATRRGRYHPRVQRLARGLARAGFLVVVPDLPGLRLGEITATTIEATVSVARTVAARADVRGGRVSFYGVSVGATLSLLAAANPALRGRVRAVGGEAPWVDLKKVIRLATTGYYGPTHYQTDPYARLAIARSLAAGLPRGRDRARLRSLLERVADDDPHPLTRLRSEVRLGPAGRGLVSLLLNTSPSRFSPLYARLQPNLRRRVQLLSPLIRARRLSVPVELASAPHDRYFPPAESRSLATRSKHVRVTVTSTLDHAIPALSLRDIGDLVAFDQFIVRFVHDAQAH